MSETHGKPPNTSKSWAGLNKTSALVIQISILVATALALLTVVLTFPPQVSTPNYLQIPTNATVLTVVACLNPQACPSPTAQLTSGSEAGTIVEINNAPSALRAGDQIKLGYLNTTPLSYYFFDYQRITQLWIILGLVAAIVIFAGKGPAFRGLLALVGSITLLIVYTVPALLTNTNPLIVSAATVVLVASLGTYLTMGRNLMASIASAAIVLSLLATSILGFVAILFLRLSGSTGDDTSELLNVFPSLDLRTLAVAAIVLGALGAIDDVCVAQVATVFELHAADTKTSKAQLIGSSLRVGRAHLAAAMNTLVFAYAGSSLAALLLLASSGLSFSQLASGQFLALEITAAAVGAAGLAMAVPLSSILAAHIVVTRHEQPVPMPGPFGSQL